MAEEFRENGPVEEGAAEGAPRVREADDAAREAAAEAAAAATQQAMARLQRDESQAKKGDHGFAQALIRFLQGQADPEYLACIVQLLDRNVPAYVLLGTVSLLDDVALADVRASIDVPQDTIRTLATTIETTLAPRLQFGAGSDRMRQWALLLTLVMDRLDVEDRQRLRAENRDADQWFEELLQRTVVAFVGDTPAVRPDAARAATLLRTTLLDRPSPGRPMQG